MRFFLVDGVYVILVIESMWVNVVILEYISNRVGCMNKLYCEKV